MTTRKPTKCTNCGQKADRTHQISWRGLCYPCAKNLQREKLAEWHNFQKKAK